MRVATVDRGEIIHFAGASGLSPALRRGAPAFASGHDPSLARCGWETFFAALEGGGLALVRDPEGPGPADFAPVAEVRDLLRHRSSMGDALARAARFLGALLRREPDPPGP